MLLLKLFIMISSILFESKIQANILKIVSIKYGNCIQKVFEDFKVEDFENFDLKKYFLESGRVNFSEFWIYFLILWLLNKDLFPALFTPPHFQFASIFYNYVSMKASSETIKILSNTTKHPQSYFISRCWY